MRHGEENKTIVIIGKNMAGYWNFGLYNAKGTDSLEVEGKLDMKNIGSTDKLTELAQMANKLTENHLLKTYGYKKMDDLMEYIGSGEDSRRYFENLVTKVNISTARLLTKNNELPIFIRENPNERQFRLSKRLYAREADAEFDNMFHRCEGGMNYERRLKIDGKQIALGVNDHITIIAESPCLAVINNELLILPSIKGSRLASMAKACSIFVKESMIDEYVKKFVGKIIATEHVESDVFGVEYHDGDLTAELSAAKDHDGKCTIVSKYEYDGHELPCNNLGIKKDIVETEKTEGKTLFRIWKRDYEREKKLENLLQEEGLERKGDYLYPQKKASDEIINILEAAEIKANFKIKDKKLKFTSSTTEHQDWFDVKINITCGEYTFPFVKLRNNILKREPLFRLPDGTFFEIPEEWFTRYSDIMANSTEETLKVEKDKAGIFTDIDSRMSDYVSKFTDNDIEVPASLRAELRDYQKKGFRFLANRYEAGQGACLADDMGLGKTVQFIAFLLYIYRNNRKARSEQAKQNDWPYQTEMPTLFDQMFATAPADKPSTEAETEHKQLAPTLIVVPTSVIDNWKRELQKFAPTLRVRTYIGKERRISKQIIDFTDVLLTTYGVMSKDESALKQYEFECIALDEAHNIRTRTSQMHKVATTLKAKKKYAISGTPLQNNISDLWAQFHFIKPELLGGYDNFCKTFSPKKTDEMAHLRMLTSPFIIRRTKEEVCPELPKLTSVDVVCEMNEDVKKAYTEQKSAARNMLLHVERSSNLRINALTQLQKLRQIAIDPSMIFGEEAGLESPKYDFVIDKLAELHDCGHKSLVFSSFKQPLHNLAKMADEMGLKSLTITGETPERQQIIDQFQEDGSTDCLFISLKAGGEGLNITAATYVFILDPWWNPAAEDQAVARAHRIGQTKPVTVYSLVTKDTVEEKVKILQEQKRELAESLIAAKDGFASISDEELVQLFD